MCRVCAGIRSRNAPERGSPEAALAQFSGFLSITRFGGGLRRFRSVAEIRRFYDLEPEVLKESSKYFLDGGAIRSDLRNRAAFPGHANSEGDRHDRWTETAR